MNAITFCLTGWLLVVVPGEESVLDRLGAALSEDGRPPRQMVVRFVDQAGKPVAGAAVNLRIDTQETNYTGDADGKAMVSLPAKDPGYLRMWAKAKGYVTLYASWRNGESKDPVPAEFTFPMRPGISIGGVVRDEAGRPIEGVVLKLRLSMKDPPQGRIKPSTAGFEARTGPDGKWRCDDVPAGLARVTIQREHPDYISDTRSSRAPSLPLTSLKEMAGVLVMTKGIALEGTVTGADGSPVAGATVAQGGERLGGELPLAKTDQNGRYRFAHCKPGPMVLTVAAPGWAPDLRTIGVHEKLGPVDFKLSKGHTLRVRLVGPDGKPVPGVRVSPDTWRSHRSLYGLGIRQETDAQGRFVWDWAPADEVLFSIYGKGYMSLRDHGLTARQEEYVLTMYPPLVISGRVVDAQTKQPVATFRAVPGIDWDRPGRSPSWQRHSVQDIKGAKDGRYSVQFTYPYPKLLVRIEADGYLPASSESFTADQGKVTFDFELAKGAGPEGVVLGPDGKPLEGAPVYLCSGSSRPYVQNGRNIYDQRAVKATSGPDGKFRLPPQTEAYSLLVLHDSGYAEVSQESLAQGDQIRLQQWARVEGVLRIGPGPGAEQNVALYVQRPPRERDVPQSYFDYDATTDSQGRFTFERVLPGRATIHRTVRFSVRDSGHSAASSHGVSTELQPGETARVEIGGTGRPVEGRLVLPEDEDEPVDFNFALGRISPKRQEIPYPEGFKEWTAEAQRDWHLEWQQSDAYQKYLQARQEQVSYAFNFKADGSFRCDDVPAGDYKLSISVYDVPLPNK